MDLTVRTPPHAAGFPLRAKAADISRTRWANYPVRRARPALGGQFFSLIIAPPVSNRLLQGAQQKMTGSDRMADRRIAFGAAFLLFLASSLWCAAARSAESGMEARAPDWSAALASADKRRGAEISANGANGGPPCRSCHGPAASRRPGLPRLAGLNAPYVARELFAFANRLRPDDEMRAATASLTPQDMADLGAYYESLRPAATATAPASGEGPRIHNDGVRGVMPCGQCHGADATGVTDDAPSLAGQEPAYVVKQLGAFAEGARKSRSAMNDIAAKLTDAERVALAQFYASLPPRGAAP